MYKRSTDEFLFAVHDVNALLLLTQALTGKIINCIRALRVLRGEEKLQDFGEIAATAEDRISIVPGVKPGTVPAR